MTATARRRPITSHPAFAPLIALWFTALLGLTVAVLPATVLENWLAGAGLDGLAPLMPATRAAMAVLAAAIGGLTAYALTQRFVAHAGGYPRPLYAEAEPADDESVDEMPTRRPLHVREELADGFGDESEVVAKPSAPRIFATLAQTPEDFMILTPQPIHPAHPQPDLEALLDQFDTAFAAFRTGERGGREEAGAPPDSDPVQTFVARQTGAPRPAAAPAASPMGGLVPDHQAELRAALDKLARSQHQN